MQFARLARVKCSDSILRLFIIQEKDTHSEKKVPIIISRRNKKEAEENFYDFYVKRALFTHVIVENCCLWESHVLFTQINYTTMVI